MAESFGVKGRVAVLRRGRRGARRRAKPPAPGRRVSRDGAADGERGRGAARGAGSSACAGPRAVQRRPRPRPGPRIRGRGRASPRARPPRRSRRCAAFIDSPRWQGVPFFIRTGKSLPLTATEATIRWKRAAMSRPRGGHRRPPPTTLAFALGPDNVIALGANVKKDGEAMVGERSELVLRRCPADEMKPYERLIGDALDGDSALFADQESVEQSWRVVDPIAASQRGLPLRAGLVGPRGGVTHPARRVAGRTRPERPHAQEMR